MEIVPETERMDLASAIAKTSQCMGIVEGLKPKQMEAIESFVSEKDTFVALWQIFNPYQKIFHKNENKYFCISLRKNTVLSRTRSGKCQQGRNVQLTD